MSKNKIVKRCKEILNKIDINDFVTDPDDFNFLMQAFAMSPYFEMKTQGQQITAIQKRLSNCYSTSCFFLIRKDGTKTDISYTKMFKKDHQTDDVLNALRTAIDPIISEYRRSFKPFKYGGKIIERVEDVDVDHYNLKFRELASIWIEANGGVAELIKKVNETEDGSTITCFTDEKLIENFRVFHNANTHLRFLPKEVNRRNH